MRIIHTSDWHLGKTLCGQSLIDDQAYFINEFFLPLVQEQTPDIVIISGDIFDKNIAPVDTIRLFDSFIGKMSKLKIPLAVITGNHDSRERIAIGTELLKNSGIYIAADTGAFNSPVELCENGIKYKIYLLPYFSKQQANEYLGEDCDGYADAFGKIISKIEQTMSTDDVNILAAHCFVSGSSLSESENPIYVGNSSQVSAGLFKSFDYTALGHLHSPQYAGNNIRYSGSPLKYSFDEERQKKSVTLLELNGKNIDVKEICVPAIHDVKTLTGSFDELMVSGEKNPSEDYIHIHLTDDFPIFMPVDRLRAFYPNILSLSCDYIDLKNEITEYTAEKQSSDEEMFRQFMLQINGSEPTEAELELFMSYLGQADAEVKIP